MKVDLHVHSIASRHAFNTILEIAQYAASHKLEAVAITDHGPAMEDISKSYFYMLRRVPSEISGVRILKGCEANIIDQEGNIDISAKTQADLDLVLVGLHGLPSLPRDLGPSGNTDLIIRTLEKNRIHILAHPYRSLFPVEIRPLFAACQRLGVLMEVNLSLVKGNLNDTASLDNLKLLVDLSLENKTKIVVNSDAHFVTEIADDSVLAELPFKIPPEIILGASGYQEVAEFLKTKK